MDYKGVIDSLEDRLIFPNGCSFLNYSGFKNANVYQLFYEFGQTYLSRNDLPFNIPESYLTFNNNDAFANARCYTKNGIGVIEIYQKLFEDIFDFFFIKAKVIIQNNEALINYKLSANSSGVPLYFLMFQSVTNFVFYHEAAHLAQQYIQNNGEDSTQSYNEFINDYREKSKAKLTERYIREHDADWFAASQMGNHAIQLTENYCQENNECFEQMIESYASIICASFLIYFLMSSNEKETRMYFWDKKRTHPHFLIRLSYSVKAFIDSIRVNLEMVEGLDIDSLQSRIIRNSLFLSSDLIADEYNLDLPELYRESILKNKCKIESYLRLIHKKSFKYPFLMRISINAEIRQEISLNSICREGVRRLKCLLVSLRKIFP